MQALGVGIVGCGDISRVYLEEAPRFSDYFQVVACTDILEEKARERAQQFGIPTVCASLSEMLALPEVEIVLNLTIPKAHGEVAMQALEAGKHVYNEKPLALTLEDATKMLQCAQDKGLSVCCAPDTVLGAGIQTCRKVLDDGWIGRVVSGTAFMQCPGHESWHPSPEFYYQQGGGPLFDMGPYYLTGLITLLGPVSRVTACTGKAQSSRRITSKPKFGQNVAVEVPTHVAGILEFESGAIITMIMSFDVQAHTLPCIELYGANGSMQVPDPNTFGGPVKIMTQGNASWSELPMPFAYAEQSRGLGLAEQADNPFEWDSIEDLHGLRIGVVSGYVNTDAFDAACRSRRRHPGDGGSG